MFANVEQTNCSATRQCTSKQCIKIASTILERIDTTVDPCDDFYQFSCGNFIRTTSVPEDYVTKNVLLEIQTNMFIEIRNYLEQSPLEKESFEIEQVKKLYQSCMNVSEESPYVSSSTMDSLFELIAQVTGSQWPIINNHQQNDESSPDISLEKKLATLFLHQVQPFFQVFVAPNKNTSTYALHVKNEFT